MLFADVDGVQSPRAAFTWLGAQGERHRKYNKYKRYKRDRKYQLDQGSQGLVSDLDFLTG